MLVSGCGGLPGEYSDVLQNASGPNATACSTSGQAVIFGALRIENPGDRILEIQSVRFPDALPSSVEFYVMAVPSEQSGLGGSGSTLLADDFDDLPQLAALWQERQAPPAEVAPGFSAEIVVVLDGESDPAPVHYINEIEVTVAVGERTETASLESLRMAGTSDSCEATASGLRDEA